MRFIANRTITNPVLNITYARSAETGKLLSKSNFMLFAEFRETKVDEVIQFYITKGNWEMVRNLSELMSLPFEDCSKIRLLPLNLGNASSESWWTYAVFDGKLMTRAGQHSKFGTKQDYRQSDVRDLAGYLAKGGMYDHVIQLMDLMKRPNHV